VSKPATIKRVLVVDDSSTTRALIVAAIEEMEGFETIEAPNGFEALKRIPQQSLDLIVTDINMPDINGLEIVHFVKHHPEYRTIPMLIVSTEGSDEDVRRGLNLGASAYVKKPFEPEHLQSTIRRLIGST
jgi:two-component system chemotaxis response regulator CheY